MTNERAWTPTEDALIRRLVRDGVTYRNLHLYVPGRSLDACRCRAEKLPPEDDPYLTRVRMVIEAAADRAGVNCTIAQLCLANSVTPKRGMGR